MHIDALLNSDGVHVHKYALHLYQNNDELSSSQATEAPLVDVALWDISDAEWRNAQTAVLIQLKSDQLSGTCPVIVFSEKAIEETPQRLQLWGGRELRPNIIEDWLGISLLPNDEQLLIEIVRLLPSGWSLIIEGRGVRG